MTLTCGSSRWTPTSTWAPRSSTSLTPCTTSAASSKRPSASPRTRHSALRSPWPSRCARVFVLGFG
jgi:hypothetical protein